MGGVGFGNFRGAGGGDVRELVRGLSTAFAFGGVSGEVGRCCGAAGGVERESRHLLLHAQGTGVSEWAAEKALTVCENEEGRAIEKSPC